MTYIENYKKWLDNVSPEEKEELLALEGNDTELKERFSLPLAFGTAGMRGVLGLGTYRMNEYTVRRATQGLAEYVKSLGAEAMARGVVIAYDTRHKSFEFAFAAAKVLAHHHVNVFFFENVRPVPLCSFTIGHFKAIAGIMITASHNPKEYNGYKVYGDDGAQMSPEATAEVVKLIEKADYFGIEEGEVEVESKSYIHNLNGEKINPYITVIGKSVDEAYYRTLEKLSLSPEAVAAQGGKLKIVYTPLHGTGYVPVTTMFDRMKIPYSVVPEQAMPNGSFPTVKVPNPEMPDALTMGIALAEKIKGDVVIGTDPDADRMGVAVKDDSGKFVLLNGNQIGALLMDYILKRHRQMGDLPINAAVVKTIVTTSLARKIAESYGVECFDVLTGFKFIGEKIKTWLETGEHTFMFGYEESYGYLCGTHAKDKDAVVSAMLFAEMVCFYKNNGVSVFQRLKRLFQKHGHFCEKSIALTFPGLDGMKIMADKMDNLGKKNVTSLCGIEVERTDNYNTRISTYRDGITKPITLPKSNVMYYALSSGDWVCARPSGTEPKLKFYVSACASDQRSAEEKANALLEALKNEVN